MEQKREWKLTPYMLEDGRWVMDHLVWSGYCSACNEKISIEIGTNRPAVALLNPNGSVGIVYNTYDEHPCKEQPWKLNRKLHKQDMAHPMTDAHFVPTSAEQLYYDIFGKM